MTLGILFCQPAVGDSDITVPATSLRRLIKVLAGGQGVVAPPSNVVTHRAAGANFSVDIAAFDAIVTGDDVANQGSYHVWNDTGAYNLSTFAGGGAISAPASGTRTHRLVAQVQDHRANGSYPAGTYTWLPQLLQDTGSGEPAEPASALTLAHVSISAGQANIQDSHITNAYPILGQAAPNGPWSSNQVNPGAWDAQSVWTDFSGGNWPSLTFTVPPSGKVYVTISASPYITANNGTAVIGWRMSGTDTLAAQLWRGVGVVGAQTSGVQAAKRRLVTGLTAGGSNTVTVCWYRSNVSANDGGDGQLLVEAVP